MLYMDNFIATVAQEAIEWERSLRRDEDLFDGRYRMLKLLARLLERRFGPLPDEAKARMYVAELARIEIWFDALLDAPSLAAVLDREAYVGTIVETSRAEGKAVGLAEDLAAAYARGLAEDKAEILLRLLLRRFGPVTRTLRDRVAGADVAQIDAWLAAALDAPSLSAVFDPNISH